MNLRKNTVGLAIRDMGKVEVMGYEFEYEGLKFNVHKSHKENDKSWKVTEVITGMLVVSYARTRKDALEKFVNLFERYGKEKFEYMIETSLKKVDEYMNVK